MSAARRIERALRSPVERFGMQTTFYDQEKRKKLLVMVSKFDHALLHLLYQIRVGWLDAHGGGDRLQPSRRKADRRAGGRSVLRACRSTRRTRLAQEAKLQELVLSTEADLVVLARYMQVLSDTFSRRLFGRVINIHHSFLPSFKGAKPYHQAHERGVKIIGATAHYVTPELDEGPIIEQETARVNHAMSAEDLLAVGRDIESRVLARAVKLHLESRVMLNGRKTVVFG